MWPTAQTPWLLFLGLIPLAYLGWFVVRYGKSEITSLQFIVVTLIWIGYHLSPTLAYFEGRPWDSFLLSSAYIDQALLFSVLNMFAILIGYRLVMRKTDIAMRNSIASRWILPRVKWSWILWLSLLTLIIVIYVKGGFSDFWDASYSRGSRQWAERTLLVRIERALNVMIAPLSLVLIVFSSIHILRNPYGFNRLLIGGIGVFVGITNWIHSFSRLSGFGIFILAVLSLKFSKTSWKNILAVLLLLLIGYHLGAIGLEQRGNYNPGIANYIKALFSADIVVSKSESWISPEFNPIDSVAPFTRRVEAKHSFQHFDSIGFIPDFLRLINPVPSAFLDPGGIGVGLSTYMGTWGKTGLTSPAMADVFYAFSYFGFVVFVFLGIGYGYIDKYSIRNSGVEGQVAFFLAVISAGIGLHQGIRGQTRPMLYAMVIIWLVALMRRFLKK